ncbi:unnamed protein product [Arabidopsis halleri]
MTTRTSKHKRSRSDPVPRKSLKNKKSSETLCNIDRFHMDERLQREIEQLKSLLKSRKLHPKRVSSDEIDLLLQEDEVLVRREMETVIRRKLFLEDSKNEDSSIPKEAKKLVREIAGLELQVMYLETYLLLLYRRFFNNKITSELKSEGKEISEAILGSTTKVTDSPKNTVCSSQKVVEDSGIFRSHSSLSHCSGYSFRMSPQAMDSSYHRSLPFSMLEQSDIDAMIGTYVSENVHNSPNSLSEEMIKCILQVFRQLADPESLDDDRETSSPFRGKERLKVICRPYDKLLMVKSICRDPGKLNAVEPALKHFRSLVNKLEGVNPRKLNHEEKLAFWINIHNSLVMHSILVYGNPKNSMKRVSGLLKAAYNVGGRSLNLDTIQTTILGCRISRPGQARFVYFQVFRFLFASRSKGKAGDLGRDYAVTHSEPLLHFALCSGNLSDPSNVMMELECGREEYVRSNLGISKDNKILLPKLVELYAKDTQLCNVGILDMIGNFFPCEARDRIQQCRNKKHGRFSIDWFTPLSLRNDYRIFPISFNLHGNSPSLELKSELIDPHSKNSAAQFVISRVLHCEGLLLCSSQFDESRVLVWNPLTDDTKSWIKSYKLLSYYRGTKYFEIYDFDSDSWRILDDIIAPGGSFGYSELSVSLKGKTYWFARGVTETPRTISLLKFDFSTEKSVPVPLPYRSRRFEATSLTVVREDKLSVLLQRDNSSKTEIWVTDKIDETTEVVSWSKVLALDLSPRLQIWNDASFLLGKEKKVVMCCEKLIDVTHKVKDMVYIVGVDNVVTEVEFGVDEMDGCRAVIFNYVPSLIQIEQAGGNRKRGN